MPNAIDFRTAPFRVTKVSDSGRYIGETVYWRLYVIENLLRVIINSVLSDFYSTPEWWPLAAGPISVGDRTLDGVVKQVRSDHKKNANSTYPGKHNMYYLQFSYLYLIIIENNSLFLSVIPEIDQWVQRFKRMRISRNIVSHMNWLDSTDRQEINELYLDLIQLARKLTESKLEIVIPK